MSQIKNHACIPISMLFESVSYMCVCVHMHACTCVSEKPTKVIIVLNKKFAQE
jgi:hypothetical protein